MTYPTELRDADIPAEVATLVRELGSRLLSGPLPVHAQLRDQFARAALNVVTLTGVGLYANFSVPSDVLPVDPPDMIGGEVSMEVAGLDAPAGSLVKVKNGKIGHKFSRTVSQLRYRSPRKPGN
jgi:hypothetical protein